MTPAQREEAVRGLRVILVGGTSNIGKSTVAQELAAMLGWGVRSTDKMARYAGRPWPTPTWTVPPHVAEHYRTLSDAELIDGQLTHYQTMWPLVDAVIREHATDAATERLVLEGSGIWPDNVAALQLPDVAAIWLTGSSALIDARIRAESGYDAADADGRLLIERFIVRSLGYDRAMRAAIARLGLPVITVTPATTVGELADECLARMVRLDGLRRPGG